MFPFLAAIPALLDAGQSIYEAIAGKPSGAADAPSLQTAVAALPPDQQAQWNSQMQAQIDQYKAETSRLEVEEGDLSPAVLAAIGTDAAAKVALLRMTTRPWTVRKMVHLLLLPFYCTLYDMGVMVVNNLMILFHQNVKLVYLATTFFGEKSLYRELYDSGVTAAATVVISYMVLREAGKAASGGSSIGDQIGGLVSSVAGIFKKK